MNFCSKCRNSINNTATFCPYCGQTNQITIENTQNQNMNQISQNQSKSEAKQVIITVSVACFIVIVTLVALLTKNNTSAVYFSDNNNIASNELVEENNNQTKTGETSVKYDNRYVLNTSTTVSSVLDMIIKDSESQKINCPNDIVEIEKRIINNYKIDSVNLCELSKNFALEVEKIVKYMYDEYPTARGHLSHMSLGNLSMIQSSIAFFQAYGAFTTSEVDLYTGYKMKIVLNTKYYLNEKYFENAMATSVNGNHFPINSNIYSPLIHEFGHYLSFIAVNKYYGANPTTVDVNDYNSPSYKAIMDFHEGRLSKKMSEEAYANYKAKTNKNLSYDEFRGTISGYALAKDNNGNYIYDETIAESFHDYYLNGSKAADASKEVMIVLRKYLGM